MIDAVLIFKASKGWFYVQLTVACSCTLYAEFDASLYSSYIVLISNHKQPLYSATKHSAQEIGIITLCRSLKTSSISSMAVSCWNIRKTEKEYRETSDKQTYHKHTTINIIYSITNYY